MLITTAILICFLYILIDYYYSPLENVAQFLGSPKDYRFFFYIVVPCIYKLIMKCIFLLFLSLIGSIIVSIIVTFTFILTWLWPQHKKYYEKWNLIEQKIDQRIFFLKKQKAN